MLEHIQGSDQRDREIVEHVRDKILYNLKELYRKYRW